MPEVGAEEGGEPGVLSPPRRPQLLPNLKPGTPTFSVWEELPQSHLRKPRLLSKKGRFPDAGPQVHSAGHREAGAPLGARKRRPLALRLWAWYRPRPGSRLTACPCGIAWPLWASVWHPLT